MSDDRSTLPDAGRAFDLTGRLHALVALQRALASGLLEDVFTPFAQRLGAEVPFDLAYVAAISSARDDEVEVLAVHPADAEAPRPATIVPLADTPIAPVLRRVSARTGGAALLEHGDAQSLASWASSGAIVPLTAHDALVGVLVLLARNEDTFGVALSEGARWLVTAVAEPLAMAVQNGALFTRLRATMRDWETTFDVMDAMVCITDDQGLVRRGNWAMAKRLATSPSALVGRPLTDLFPGQPLPIVGHTPRTSLVGPREEPLRASAVTLPGGGTVVVMHDARGMPAPPQSYAALRRVSTGSQVVRGTVLVVDDEPSILRAVSRTLARSQNVVTATDGDEALEIIRAYNGAFHAVMTDVQMQRIGGIELYRAIEREFPVLAERFLFMTGGVFGGEADHFLRGLKQRVLRKPFDPDLLRRTIDERVALSHVA